jgi:putative peptide zinc metalloprotease protein
VVTTSHEPGLDSRVEFFDLRTRPEDDGSVVVGRADIGDFVALPELGATIIRELSGGARIGDVEQALLKQGVEMDVAGFVAQLSGLGFVRAGDGIPDPAAPPARPGTLPRLRARHVRWLFTRPAYAAYLLTLAAAVTALVLQPRVRPHYGDIFFSGSTSAVLAGTTGLFLVIVALHEFAHLASARASGVPARISFGTRLYSLVAQTDVSGMWAAARAERLRTYLAGMGLDLVLASVLILARAADPGQAWPGRVMAAAVVMLIVGVAGQFQLFMRTDMYFVAADLLRARNLFEDSAVQLVHLLRVAVRRAPGTHPLAGLPRREHRVVKAYGLVMVAGTAAALAVFAVYLLPALVVLLDRGAHRLADGISSGNVPVAADGGVTLVVEGGTELVVVLLMLRSRLPWIRSLRGRLRPPDQAPGRERA